MCQQIGSSSILCKSTWKIVQLSLSLFFRFDSFYHWFLREILTSIFRIMMKDLPNVNSTNGQNLQHEMNLFLHTILFSFNYIDFFLMLQKGKSGKQKVDFSNKKVIFSVYFLSSTELHSKGKKVVSCFCW